MKRKQFYRLGIDPRPGCRGAILKVAFRWFDGEDLKLLLHQGAIYKCKIKTPDGLEIKNIFYLIIRGKSRENNNIELVEEAVLFNENFKQIDLELWNVDIYRCTYHLISTEHHAN